MVAVSVSPTGRGTAGLLLMNGTEPAVTEDDGVAAGVSLSFGCNGPKSTGAGLGLGPERGELTEVHEFEGEGEEEMSPPEVGAGEGSEGKPGDGCGVTTLTGTFSTCSQLL